MPVITQSFADFPKEHAFRHPMKSGGRESLAHMLMFPEHGIAGFIYPTVLADGHAKGRATLFGPGLKEPIHEQIDKEVAASLNFDNWTSGLNQHYKWFHATTERCSIHFFEMLSFGRRQLRGFLHQDGVMRHLTDVTYDDQMMQKTFKATVTDTDGRKVLVDCKTFASIQL